jgi:5-methylcytosine-specific restriction endonuclease McrA
MARIIRHGYAPKPRGGSTRAWREARVPVLATARRCALCGGAPSPADPFEVDHIKPVATHPHLEYEPTNLRAAHRSCNRRRGVG